MAIPVGGGKHFVSKELLVAQDDFKRIGKTVESLSIECDKAAVEEYLFRNGSPKVARQYRKDFTDVCICV